MGLLADAFIATDVEVAAASFERAGGPIHYFPTLQSKNIDPVKLAVLEEIAIGQSKAHTEPVRDFGEAWIFPVSETLIDRLAVLDVAEMEQLGAQWAAHQEMWWGGYNAPPDPAVNAAYFAGVKQYVRGLCQLAAQARAEEKQVYLWVCL